MKKISGRQARTGTKPNVRRRAVKKKAVVDRTKYYHEHYLKNKERKKRNTYAWLERYKKKHGVKKFKEWKRKENEKYAKRKRR